MGDKMDGKTIDDVIRIASALKDILDSASPDTWTLLCAISLAMIDGTDPRIDKQCKGRPESPPAPLNRTVGGSDTRCKPQPEKPSAPRSRAAKEWQEGCRLEPPPAPPNRSIRDWWCWWWQPELKRTKGDDDAHAYARYINNYNLTVGNE